MKAKKLLLVLCTVVALVCCIAFAACKEKEPDPVTPAATEYTVTFDANGGTLTGNATLKVKEGEKITNAPVAAKTDYDFSGWYTLATDGDKIELTTYTVTKDVTLYAHYTEKQVTPPAPLTKIEVTFDANGGTITGDNKIEVDEDGLILDLPVATRNGYRFDAWYTAAEGGEVIDPMFDEISESTTLYAHWIKTCVVTFDAGEGELTGSATVTVDENARISAGSVPTAAKAGDEFHGWYTAATGGEAVDFETYRVTDNVTLYARYGVLTMPLKTLKNNEGNNVGYRIEAEDAKIEGTLSSDNSAGTGFLEETATASGGHSVGYFNVAGNTMTFTFNSATAGKANISLLASSTELHMDFSSGFEMWPVDTNVTTANFTVTLNGTPAPFGTTLLRGSYENFVFNKFWDTVDLGELDVKSGLNVLVVTAGAAGAPNFDCLDIQTSLTLTSANGNDASGEATLPAPPAEEVIYEKNVTVKLIVGGYEGGPAINKSVIGFEDDITKEAIATSGFAVSLGGTLGVAATDNVYLCDANGEELAESVTSSKYVAIEYAISYNGATSSFAGNLSPFSYNMMTGKNSWKDVSSATFTINSLEIDGTEYTKFGGTATVTKEVPCLADWKLDGTFSDTITWDNAERTINLTYGAYEPEALKNDNGKNPLIIWLHGGGEGGTDPAIAILGNQVTGISSEKIQAYFKTVTLAGAYILAPQTPTQWMDIGDGAQASSPENSVYTESLFKLIRQYAEETNTDIDLNRIYIGGCSNGGWMTLELLADHGEYFAAAYPVSACYDSQYITDEMIAKLKDIPVWFTHSKADSTLPITEYSVVELFPGYSINQITDTLKDINTNELYIKLINAGATNVYYSLFETVTADEVTYNGHWSWIYTLRDDCNYVQSTTGTGENGEFTLGDLNTGSTNTVKLTDDGEAAGLWQWLAAQAKTPADEA